MAALRLPGNNCVDIPGATGDTYTLTDEDLGHTIHVIVSASNDAGSEDAIGPVSPADRPGARADADPDAHAHRDAVADPDGHADADPGRDPDQAVARQAPLRAGGTTPSGPIAGDSVFGGSGRRRPRQRPRQPGQRHQLPAAGR